MDSSSTSRRVFEGPVGPASSIEELILEVMTVYNEIDCQLPPYKPCQDGQIVILSVCQGSIVTALGKEVRIRPWEDSNLQKWKVEEQEGRFGFRNLHSGMLLGVQFFGNVFAGKSHLNE